MRSTAILQYSEARRALDSLLEEIGKSGASSAVIAVTDPHGEIIALARMDDAPVSSIRIAANKAYTAARERKPTHEIGQKSRHPEKGFDLAWFGDDRFVGWGGGVPVWRNGQVVGAIAVSGLPQAEDIRLATWAAAALGEEKQEGRSLELRPFPDAG